MKRVFIILLGVSFLFSGCTIEYSFYLRNCFDIPLEVSISGLSRRAENFISNSNGTYSGYLSYSNEILTITRDVDMSLKQTLDITLVEDSLSLKINKLIMPAKSTFLIQQVTHETPTNCEVIAVIEGRKQTYIGDDMKIKGKNNYYIDIEP
jgi:hypothetical protein